MRYMNHISNTQCDQFPNFLYTNMKSFEIPTTSFEHLVNLTELDLSDNNMTTIDPEVFSYLTKLETLDLSGNRFDMSLSFFDNLKQIKNLKLD